MSSTGVLGRIAGSVVYGLSLVLLISCSSYGQTQDQISLPPNTKIEIGFSPNGSSLELILKGIQQSQSSILVATYSFTSKPISLALLEAHNRGVSVQVIADKKSNSGKYSAITFLANHSVPVRVNGSYQIFHHKFMVIDGLHIETGSFNYSDAAVKKNAENVLFIWNHKEIAEIYTQQWKVLWEESEPLTSNY
ncbi:phospholipase D family protein [Desulfovibrio sp. OttesenSCG-928-G11]|nr:phospholipase D family protein [Desulfovibrio sp. OttesenSCG-928-G11]